MTDRELMQQVLEALEGWNHVLEPKPDAELISALRSRLAQPEQEPIHVPVTDNTYGYAKSLAEAIFKQHFASDEHYASGRIVWGVNDTVIGILTQIDNMVSGMVRKPAQPEQEPVAWIDSLYDSEMIKELAEQAHCYACEYAQRPDYNPHNPYNQLIYKKRYDSKFAELIVRKCIQVCNSRVGNIDYNTGRTHCASDEDRALQALAQPEQEPVAHAFIAGALFDFMGWLTSRKERIVLSSADNASSAVEVIAEFAKMRRLSLDDAKVQDWQDALAQEPNMPEQYVMVGRFMLQPHLQNGYWLTDTGTSEAMQIFQPEMEQVIKKLWSQF